MKVFLKNFMIFCVGFTLYQCIEGIWKTIGPGYGGVECFVMGIIGGMALLFIGQLNKIFRWDTPIWLQSIIGGSAILLVEFIFGLLINKLLCPLLNRPIIWDYSDLPYNIKGQICPQFFFAWIFLAAVCIVVDDFLRWKVYNEEKPRYTLWWKK